MDRQADELPLGLFSPVIREVCREIRSEVAKAKAELRRELDEQMAAWCVAHCARAAVHITREGGLLRLEAAAPNVWAGDRAIDGYLERLEKGYATLEDLADECHTSPSSLAIELESHRRRRDAQIRSGRFHHAASS